jgi:acyl-coenzyme A synthetase/AMP-(fatty) acid ligase/uncharacterized membrane protein/3-hydroxymyristoyl/3-hydroxydecanoyl-(acyl carrier protein) dehydratase
MTSKLPKILFYIAAVLYPAFIYYFLVIRQTPLRLFSLFIIAFALLAFITRTSSPKSAKKGSSFAWTSLLLLGVGVLCLVTNSKVILKLYPVLMNVLFLAGFGVTCFAPPTMIFRFATMQDKSIKGSLSEKRVETYCRKVTIAWCVFFIFNGSAAAWTIFSGSDVLWSVYNGGISYILIGVFFMGELIIRKMVQKKMPNAVPFSALKKNSRDPAAVVCYEGVYGESAYKTWGDFLAETAQLRRQIEAVNSAKWLLYCEDYWYFLLAFTALLQCKKEIRLSANVSPAYIAEIRGCDNSVPFITDQVFPAEGKTLFIPALLNPVAKADVPAGEAAAIIADETSIIMYTSGSTGQPKEVQQRLTEFENDNRFVLSMWGEEFLKRKLCSTVSPHHIYGLLFSILLPFTAGVPFRRKRIEFPEEMEKLSDTEYMIITVPAFLKRAVEIEKLAGLRLKSPWIFTSGGALDPETAQKTNDVFGFWPVEVYGSTETSGIAWRQSVNGMEWTPFDNTQLSKNDYGCLVIRSPYIKDPAGFQTADMVEMLKDGRFLLKGRFDSVVKIEEKRISLPEMESRILQSGFAADVCVIFLEDRRQYLAAAVVFNDKGKERFAGLAKHEINSFWREYLLQYFENVVIPKKWRYLETLPVNAQGKKQKEHIKLLFSGEHGGGGGSAAFDSLNSVNIIDKNENSISLEFSVPDSSPYFDGHFPGFPILPAVAQMELVTRFASRYLGTGVGLAQIRRIKFTGLIRPRVPLLLKLAKNKNTLSFNFSSPEDATAYSAGTVVLENA